MQPKIAGANCSACDLCRRPFVPPHIPTDAIALVIGEAPGATEAAQGKPFVGDSGRILSAVFGKEVDPKVAKTNAVLCRPINNDTPSAQAIQACQGALQATLNALPDVPVILAGGTALDAARRLVEGLPDGGILKARGHTYGRYTPTVHPAYVYRNPPALKLLQRDVHAALYGSQNDFDALGVSYTLVASFGQLRAVLGAVQHKQLVAFDVETDHLIWYDTPKEPKAKLLALGLALDTKHAIIITPELVASRADLWQTFFDSISVIGHNAKYDQTILAQYGIRVKCDFDTMLASYALDETKGNHGLKALATNELGAFDYEDELITKWFTANKVKKGNRRYSLLPKDDLYKYLAIDCCATFALAIKLRAALEEKRLTQWPFNNVLMPTANTLVQVELDGIKIDRAWLTEVNKILIKQLGMLHKQMRVFNNGADFNASSPMQMNALIYNTLGLKLTKRLIKPTSTNTGKEALDALPDHPFIHLLREYRRIEKMRNTYVNKLLELADTNDRIHVSYNIHGTEIGRLSANDSLHGIPRPDDIWGQMIRCAFIAEPDYSVVVADYSQAELRVFAVNSDERRLIEAYQKGIDVHNQTAIFLEDAGTPFFKGYQAAKASGDDKTVKRMRVTAKNCNFGILCYQGGPQGVYAMLPHKIPIPILASIAQYFKEIYPRAFTYADEQFEFLRTHGYVKTRFNRYRRFPLITRDNADEARKAAVHMVTASEAADLTHLSIVDLMPILTPAKIVHTMHDSILVETPTSIARLVAKQVQTIMQSTGNTYIPQVPWIADVDISDRWVAKPDLSVFYAARQPLDH